MHNANGYGDEVMRGSSPAEMRGKTPQESRGHRQAKLREFTCSTPGQLRPSSPPATRTCRCQQGAPATRFLAR